MTFPWDRHWVPSGISISTDFDGFLPDPTTPIGAVLIAGRDGASVIRRLADLAAVPLLALEGETGIGKSTIVQRAVQDLKDHGENAHYVDAAELESVTSLVDGISQPQSTGATRTYFLDSIDECDHLIARRLPRVVRTAVEHGVRLRLVCRAAGWPEKLREEVKAAGASFYETLPLTRDQIKAAAKQYGVDPDEFLRELRERSGDPLAAKPLTLLALLEGFKNHRMPRTRVELFAQECERHCTESNPGHRDRDAQLRNIPSAAQRVRIVERTAAFAVLCDRPYIRLRAALPGENTDRQLSAGDIVESVTERFGELEAAFTAADFGEAVDCGLLPPGPSDTLTFGHRAYAEFLAARYLLDRGLKLKQVVSLITHPAAPAQVAPQLRDLAGWLASISIDVARWLATTDPTSLLEADVSDAPDEIRVVIARGLLDAASRNVLPSAWFSRRHVLRTLRGTGVVTELHQWLKDKKKSVPGRLLAVDIARRAKLDDLTDALIDVALDKNEHPRFRARAAEALDSLPRIDRFSALAAAVNTRKDSDDDLRGAVVDLLWPDAFKAPFDVLTRPRRDNYTGSYAMFLSSELPRRLRPDLLHDALVWVRKNGYRHHDNMHIESAHDHVLRMAWRHTDDDRVRGALADIVRDRQKNYGSPYPRNRFGDEDAPFVASPDARRTLAVELAADGVTEPEALVFSQGPLLVASDLAWALDQSISAGDNTGAKWWATAAMRLYWNSGGTIQAHETLVAAAERSSIIAEQARPAFGPLDPTSPDVKAAKKDAESYAKLMERDRQREEDSKKRPPLAELLSWATTNVDWWNRIAHELMLDEGYRAFDTSATACPLWKSIDEATRRSVLDVADTYLRTRTDDRAKWLTNQATPWSAIAGVVALELLSSADPTRFKNLPADVWRNWAGSALYAASGRPHVLGILRTLYALASDLVLDLVRTRISAEATWESDSTIDEIAKLWDDRIEHTVLDLARDNATAVTSVKALLAVALQWGSDAAVAAAFDAIARFNVARKVDVAVAIARSLFAYRAAVFWQRRSEIGDDKFIAQVFLSKNIDDHTGRRVAAQLSSDAIADLYLWLVKNFPPKKDPNVEGAHAVSARESVGDFRNQLLVLLVKGGDGAVAALERIRDLFPGQAQYERLVGEARDNMLTRTWEPVEMPTLRALIAHRQKRRVESSHQLQELLLELLDEYGAQLRGSPSRIRALWNFPDDAKKRAPKDENDFSDSLADFLRRELKARAVLLHRESQVRRGAGADAGQEPDLTIETVGAETDVIGPTVLCEVKGDWHRDLRTAMQMQLVDRYLHAPYTHGIYIVGFFSKKGANPEKRLKTLREFLAKQAAGLSIGDCVVHARVIDCTLRLVTGPQKDAHAQAGKKKAGKKKAGKKKGGTRRSSPRPTPAAAKLIAAKKKRKAKAAKTVGAKAKAAKRGRAHVRR